MEGRRASGKPAIWWHLIVVTALVALGGCESPTRPAKDNLAAFEEYAEGLAGVTGVEDATVITPDKAMFFTAARDTSATVVLDPAADWEVVAAACDALSGWTVSATPNADIQMHVTIELGSLRMDLPNDPDLTAERLQIAEQLAADPELVAVFVESVHRRVGEDTDNGGLTFYLQRSASADAATIANRWAAPLAQVAPLGILNVDYRGAEQGNYKSEVNQVLSGQALTGQG